MNGATRPSADRLGVLEPRGIVYIIREGWLGGWNVIATHDGAPMYVLETFPTHDEAQACADRCNARAET